MKILQNTSLIAATLTMGIMAGLFASWAFSVMPGMAKTDDRVFVTALQEMNKAILNGWFALCFGGALVFTAAAAVLHVRSDGRSALPWILAALVLYVIVLGVTFGVNVPLNDKLDAAGDPAGIPDMAAVREMFEDKWVRWNIVRAVTNAAALGCLAWALIKA